MAKNLTALNVALTLTTGAFSRSVASANKQIEGLGKTIGGALLSPLGLVTTALAGAFSAGAVISGIKDASERIDEMAKAADRLGISTQSLAGLRLAADESGIAAGELESAMTKLQVKVQEAATGNATAAASFAALKIPLESLVNLKADEQFGKVADAINELGSTSQRNAAMVDLFGKSGAQLSSVISGGSAAMVQAAKDADDLGLAFSRIDAYKVEEANDAFGRIGKVIQGVFNSASIKIAPYFTAVSEYLTESSKDWIKHGGFVESAIDGIVAAVKPVIQTFNSLQVFTGAFGAGLAKLIQGLVQLAKFAEVNIMLVLRTIDVMFKSLQVSLVELVNLFGKAIGNILMIAAQAADIFNATLATTLANASTTVSAFTGGMANDAREQWSASVAAAAQAGGAFNAAWGQLLTTGTMQGDAFVQRIINKFAAIGAAGMINFAIIDKTDWGALTKKIEEQAQARAKVNQDEADATAAREAQTIKDRQQRIMDADLTAKNMMANSMAADMEMAVIHRDAMNQIQMQGAATEASVWDRTWAYEQSQRERNAQLAMSGASTMLGNLAVLQQSHSKRAQQIGNVAAKAKIVNDTAAAAMASYQSLAGIPIVGPALGAAAAAAAVAAGAVQLSNVGKDSIGSSNFSGPGDASSSMGAASGPSKPSQTVILQGEYISAESIAKMFTEAKERGFIIDEVRRG